MQKITNILILLTIFTPLTLLQAKKIIYNNVVVSKIVSVYDGDTFRVNIENYPSIIGKSIPIRVSGIDTPEIRGNCKQEKILARQSRNLTRNLLKNGKVIKLNNLQRGKYFRIVADVLIDDVLLSEIQIKNNLAVRYYGGKKIKNWCN